MRQEVLDVCFVLSSVSSVCEHAIDSWSVAVFCTSDDVKTPSAPVSPRHLLVFHQSLRQTDVQWQAAHIPPEQAKWASKWDKAEGEVTHVKVTASHTWG